MLVHLRDVFAAVESALEPEMELSMPPYENLNSFTNRTAEDVLYGEGGRLTQ
jgi:hypothetical protein